MPMDACEAYLESQVRTATPQRLRLMLIDGALRFAHQALAKWDGGQLSQEAYEALVRCRDIVTELHGSIRQDQAHIARDVAAIYEFLFRLLAEAPSHQDPQRVHDVIRVLQQERETWSLVCRQMPHPPQGAAVGAGGCQEILASDLPSELAAQSAPDAGGTTKVNPIPFPDTHLQPPAPGFSLEA